MCAKHSRSPHLLLMPSSLSPSLLLKAFWIFVLSSNRLNATGEPANQQILIGQKVGKKVDSTWLELKKDGREGLTGKVREWQEGFGGRNSKCKGPEASAYRLRRLVWWAIWHRAWLVGVGTLTYSESGVTPAGIWAEEWCGLSYISFYSFFCFFFLKKITF